MTFDTLKQQHGREPCFIAELRLDKCAETYGVGACTAVLGVTGPNKCYNCFGTCQDTVNFNNTATWLFRFASRRIDGIQAAGEPPTFPTLMSVETAPTELTPGKGLGIRSTVLITLMDHTWTDVGTDPYLNDRTFDPESKSTFWRKFLSRHKYYEGRQLDILVGYLDEDGVYDASNFSRRKYFITKISGPTPDGRITIEAKDILRFTDRDKTLIPAPSEGKLAQDITAATATFNVNDNSEYAVNDYVRINDEVMKVTALPAGQLTVTRATIPSFYPGSITASEHKSGDTIQLCKLYEDDRADVVVNDILINEVGIDTSFRTLADWNTLADNWLSDHTYSCLITEPTSARQLLEEISQHLIMLWWDERQQLIRFDALKPAANNPVPTFNDDEHLIAESVIFTPDTKSRVSRVYVQYGLRTPIERLDEDKSYSVTTGLIDLDAEGPNEYDQIKVLKIKSRWLANNKSAVAEEIRSRLTVFYRNTEYVATYRLDPKDDDNWVGDLAYLDTRYRVDDIGDNLVKTYLTTRAKEVIDVNKGTQLEYTVIDDGRTYLCAIIAPNNGLEVPANPFPDYAAQSEAERVYASIADTTTVQMSNGDPAYGIC